MSRDRIISTYARTQRSDDDDGGVVVEKNKEQKTENHDTVLYVRWYGPPGADV